MLCLCLFFNLTLIPVLNFWGRSLFNTSVAEIAGRTWKHSGRFKSFAEQTYSNKGVGVQDVSFNHVMYVLGEFIFYKISM
jgi:hypothetical protein